MGHFLKRNAGRSGSGRLVIVLQVSSWTGKRGGRDRATLKRLVDRLNRWDVTCYGTGRWKTSAAMIPAEKLGVSKAKTLGIERHYGRQRHWFGRFKRRSIIVSRAQEMVDLTMALFARFRVNGDVSELFTLGMITETILSLPLPC